jgi:hypothetical protein
MYKNRDSERFYEIVMNSNSKNNDIKSKRIELF